MSDLEKLRYPIGQFQKPPKVTTENLKQWIQQIETLPSRFRKLAKPLTKKQLDTPYRPGGWTLRQVIHHVPDSHVNSYVRFKWTLTEDTPIIKAYNEAAWAKLADYGSVPVETSLDFLEILHARWVPLLKSLTEEELNKAFIHPEHGKEVPLKVNVGIYAWHGEHHLGHLKQTIEYNKW
ncbi:MAG: YfiT family bacillithiol transferase [Bacteroidota bacterium]